MSHLHLEVRRLCVRNLLDDEFLILGEKLLVGGEKTIALYEADEMVTAASWSRVWKTTLGSFSLTPMVK